MADITFSGLTTGIDTAALIKALVEAKRQPITVLRNQASDYQSRLTRIDEFVSKLTALRSATLSLASPGTFASFGATSSNSSVISVAASSAASEGNHTVTVQQLAKSQATKSNETFTDTGTAANLAGTLTLTPSGGAVNGPSNTVTVAATDTLEQIRDNINNSTVKAYGTLAFSAVPVDGATVTVDGKTYEFTAGTASGTNIKVDTTGLTTGAQAASALAAAATGGNKGDNTTMTADGSTVLVVADAAGSAGNTVAMTESGDSGGAVALSGATLSGGGAPAYSASIINTGTPSSPTYSLVLTGKSSGAANAFTASYAGTGALTFADTQAAQNAVLTVDGMSNIQRSSNVVSDVIQGLTMTLVTDTVAPNPTTPVSVTVSRNGEDIKGKVQSFITAYNDLKKYINANTKYDPASKTAGPLMGENAVSLVSDGLAGLIVNAVTGLTGSYTALSRVGVKTQSDGTLSLDAAKFDAAMGADFRGVVDLFARNYTTGTEGVAYRIQARIDRWMSSVDGLVPKRKSTILDSIRHINEQVDQKEAMVTLYEQALKVQYAKLESLVSNLKNQAGALSAISGSLFSS